MSAGFDDLLATLTPETAPLAMPGGGLAPEHVPWLTQAGVRQLHLDDQVRPGGSAKAYVDAGYVRSWRSLVDDLPVEGCPFDWSVAARIGSRELRGLPPAPSVDRLVVCHGDACAPNTVIGAAGRWVGHVDLGSLGVADRWADLAVASLSLGWNYGPGWEPEFFAAYGVDPDPERIAYYRALWDAEDEA